MMVAQGLSTVLPAGAQQHAMLAGTASVLVSGTQ
jgi:hypothetical protein